MITELMDATTNTTLFFAPAYTTDGKPDIGFRSNSKTDPIVEDISWLIAADAFVNGKRISSVKEMINSDIKNIRIKVKVHGLYSGLYGIKIITMELGERRCKNLRKGDDDTYLIDIY